MTKQERVLELYERANPVKNVDELLTDLKAASYLANLQDRSSELTQLNKRQTEQNLSSRRRLIAVAAAAVVILGTTLVLVTRDSEEVATDPSTTTTVITQQLADTFADGLAALDAGAVDGLVSPEATAMYLDQFGYSQEQPGSIQGLWEWGAVYNQTYTFDQGCRETDKLGDPPRPDENRTFYTCDYQLENDWTRAMGQPPMAGRFRMEISEGQIVWLTEDFPFADLEEAWGAVIEWVQTEHPEDFTTMFLDGLPGAGLGESAKLTEESIALWKEYNPLIVQSLSG